MNFQIEHITKKNQPIECELYFEKTGEHLDVKIRTSDFYEWLDRKDRLEWCNDSFDHDNNHVQETGRYKDGRQFIMYAGEETVKMNLADYINDNEIILQQFEN